MENLKRLLEIKDKGVDAVTVQDIPLMFQILCEFINVNPKAQELIEGYQIVMIVEIQGVETYNFILHDQRAIFNQGAIESSDFIITSDLKTLSKLFLGSLDPLEAYFSELIQIEGDLMKVIQFVEILELVFNLLGLLEQEEESIIDVSSMKNLITIYKNKSTDIKPSHVPLFLEILTTFVNNNPETKEIITDEDLVIQLKITDIGDYIISLLNNKMEWSTKKVANPNLILEMTLQNSVDLLLNGNPMSAFLEGRIIVEGDIAKALVFQSLIDVFLEFIDL
ncbi:MAG: SCP2 sterol-binding domain-containing protein [Promethearchaeota archaeon]